MAYERNDTSTEFFAELHSSEEPRNLRQIFENDGKPLLNESKNLRYQPQTSSKEPKQLHKHKTAQKVARNKDNINDSKKTNTSDKNKDNVNAHDNSKLETKPADRWSTDLAMVAQGYNGTNEVGRVGVALSRNTYGAAKLVIYKSPTKLLTTLLLTKSSRSSIPRGSAANVIVREAYVQFYDDDKRFWSLRFEEPKDEDKLKKALSQLGLLVEDMGKDEGASTGTSTLTALPKLSTTVAAAAASFADSDTESAHSNDEIITPLPATPATPATTALLMPIMPGSNAVVSSTAASKLELYLDEQRATGHVMEQKMDAILQAMCRLAANGNGCGNGCVQQLNASLSGIRDTIDNEDELLELEQKVLNYKKENRALQKNLMAKEKAYGDICVSSEAIFEELRAKNSELTKHNAALAAAVSAQANGKGDTIDDFCANCEQHLIKIASLEQRLKVLQIAMLKHNNATSAGTATTTTSAPL